jgi:hypothetical protein
MKTSIIRRAVLTSIYGAAVLRSLPRRRELCGRRNHGNVARHATRAAVLTAFLFEKAGA